MVERTYYVYLLASGRNGTLYAGVTNDLVRRIGEHRDHLVEGFTSKYHVTKLVWFEVHTSIDAAIVREKQIKKWKRGWKLELFRDSNPDWVDLYPSLVRGIW
jgi:putative endonuclease